MTQSIEEMMVQTSGDEEEDGEDEEGQVRGGAVVDVDESEVAREHGLARLTRGGAMTLWQRRGWSGGTGTVGLRVDAGATAKHNTRVRTCLTLLGQLTVEEERVVGVDLKWR
jgi:hypothetical protein